KLLQPFLQPLKVVFQLLESVEDGAVGPELVISHHILELNQRPDVERGRVASVVVGRVEVHDGARAPDGAHELVHWTRYLSVGWCRRTAKHVKTYCHRSRYSCRSLG